MQHGEMAASWDFGKLMGQRVLSSNLEPDEVEVPCDMLWHTDTDPSWDPGAFSRTLLGGKLTLERRRQPA